MLDPRLMDIICCPAVDGERACHGALREAPGGLLCEACGRLYPVEDGIPVLLQDRAARREAE
ncbi:MAG TPA: Trm112 family protein [Holophaga sp.]|nr:Trm112 family protein [Holophaga sp.]